MVTEIYHRYPMFNAERDKTLIAKGSHFRCAACQVACPLEERSHDERYCKVCLPVVKGFPPEKPVKFFIEPEDLPWEPKTEPGLKLLAAASPKPPAEAHQDTQIVFVTPIMMESLPPPTITDKTGVATVKTRKNRAMKVVTIKRVTVKGLIHTRRVTNKCACGCGANVTGRPDGIYFSRGCRQKAYRERKKK